MSPQAKPLDQVGRNGLLSIALFEGQYLLCSRASVGHAVVRLHSLFERKELNRRWFQCPGFKTGLEIALDFGTYSNVITRAFFQFAICAGACPPLPGLARSE